MFRDLIGKGIELHDIDLQQGFIKADGSVSTSADTDHSNYVVTGFINGGYDFLLHLNPEYYVSRVTVYNRDGSLFTYDLLGMDRRARKYHQLTEFSFHLHKYYKIRLTLCHNASYTPDWTTTPESRAVPDGPISPDEDIIKDFYRLDRQYFKMMPSPDPHHKDAVLRAEHLCSFVVNRLGYNEFGTVYSDQNETPGRLVREVSPYTYMTCCNNPRGVQHTEDVQSHISQYGINYATTNTNKCHAWFGMCCSNLVDCVLGFTNLHTAPSYCPGNTLNCTTITPASDCSNLLPLDTISRSSHIYVITNIWLDADDHVRFIETAESGGGADCTAFCLYSVDSFLQRVVDEGYTIQRYPKNIPDVTEPEYDYMPNSLTNDFNEIDYNNDICTFIGDKATICAGNPMFINVQRNRGWEDLVVKKFDPTTSSYVEFDRKNIADGMTYESKILQGDWIDVDITNLFPYGSDEYGKFVAVCESHGENLFDPSQPQLMPASGAGYYIDFSNNVIKKANSDPECTWAIPCKPNTIYRVYRPYYQGKGRTLFLGTLRESDLSFQETSASVPVYGARRQASGDNSNRQNCIVTDSQATYLLLQTDTTYSSTTRNLIVLQEVTKTAPSQTVNFDPEAPTLVSQSGFDYYIAKSTALECQIAVNQTDSSPTWAIPCAPNTTYIVSHPTSNPNTLLRLAWGNMADLSFTTTNTNATAYNSADCITVGDRKVSIITTGPDATYLFMQLGALNGQSTTKYVMSFEEPANDVIQSRPTRFEVLNVEYDFAYPAYVSKAHYNINVKYGTLDYIAWESTSGFIQAGLSSEGRTFMTLSATVLEKKFAQSGITVPITSGTQRIYAGIRMHGEYNSTMPIRQLYWTPVQLYTDANKTAHKDIEMSDGTLKDDSYRSVYTIDGVQEGEWYRYVYTRALDPAYAYEKAAFYDSNDQLVGSVILLYGQSISVDPPAVGTTGRWEFEVPAGATKLKVGALDGNTATTIYKLRTHIG